MEWGHRCFEGITACLDDMRTEVLQDCVHHSAGPCFLVVLLPSATTTLPLQQPHHHCNNHTTIATTTPPLLLSATTTSPLQQPHHHCNNHTTTATTTPPLQALLGQKYHATSGTTHLPDLPSQIPSYHMGCIHAAIKACMGDRNSDERLSMNRKLRDADVWKACYLQDLNSLSRHFVFHPASFQLVTRLWCCGGGSGGVVVLLVVLLMAWWVLVV